MKLISSNFAYLIYFPKKPMAMHQASINIQKPTKFKLEATRIGVEYYFHLEPNSKQLSNPSVIRKPSSTNSSGNSSSI